MLYDYEWGALRSYLYPAPAPSKHCKRTEGHRSKEVDTERIKGADKMNDKLPTIKGYCKDCGKCTEDQGDLICEGAVIGIGVIKDAGYVEPNDYCPCFEPKKE